MLGNAHGAPESVESNFGLFDELAIEEDDELATAEVTPVKANDRVVNRVNPPVTFCIFD